jgi:hypothetical protein
MVERRSIKYRILAFIGVLLYNFDASFFASNEHLSVKLQKFRK